MFSTDDTIVAVATPHGRGGIGVVRLSGSDAPRIALQLLDRQTPLQARRATFARIVDRTAGLQTPSAIDQVVATRFVAPQSYTGDDLVEISGHGSPILLQRIVELAVTAGARLAQPGEFTLRAYLNGRLDLVQAEAVGDLVDATTPLQARAAMDQLEGTLTTKIAAVEAALFDLAARLEASLDFPDEGFHFISRDQASAGLDDVARLLEALGREGRAGRVVREGRLVVIAGRPNAGKSSLFNALAGASRAIVTSVPGTTRDILTERVDIGGIAVTLVDTAGLREATDVIEAEGVRRARQAQDVAALIVLVIDGSLPIHDEDRQLASGAGPRLIAISKSDLPRVWADDLGISPDRVRHVSVLTGEGLDELRALIVSTLTDRDDWRDPPAITNARHLGCVAEALTTVERVRAAVGAGETEELVLAELATARQALEAITGRRSPDELLQHIFSRFCIGK